MYIYINCNVYKYHKYPKTQWKMINISDKNQLGSHVHDYIMVMSYVTLW